METAESQVEEVGVVEEAATQQHFFASPAEMTKGEIEALQVELQVGMLTQEEFDLKVREVQGTHRCSATVQTSAATSPPEIMLGVGVGVELANLSKASHLNGAQGVIVRESEDGIRWGIQLCGLQDKGTIYSIKPENIVKPFFGASISTPRCEAHLFVESVQYLRHTFAATPMTTHQPRTHPASIHTQRCGS